MGTLYKANSKTATKEKCDNSKQFSEANWGAKARARYKQAKGITAELWNVIETDTRAICDNGIWRLWEMMLGLLRVRLVTILMKW